MQSRARSSYAEPQPSLAMHLKMHRKGTTFALRLTNDSSDIFEEIAGFCCAAVLQFKIQ